jgi:hypothetical protein
MNMKEIQSWLFKTENPSRADKNWELKYFD